MTIINYREKRYEVGKLKAVAQHGVSIKVETQKINVLNPGVGDLTMRVVVATGDRYDLLMGVLEEGKAMQRVKLLSKPMLKKADYDAKFETTPMYSRSVDNGYTTSTYSTRSRDNSYPNNDRPPNRGASFPRRDDR